jgi:hypothetical protein
LVTHDLAKIEVQSVHAATAGSFAFERHRVLADWLGVGERRRGCESARLLPAAGQTSLRDA